ncbi:MAG: CsbD family protein [Acidithiobacillus sp.]
MNKDQIKGRMKTSTGAAKEVAGKILGDSQQESKWNLEKNLGKAQSVYGDFKEKMKK